MHYATIDGVVAKVEYFTGAIEVNSKEAPSDA
jgi:hypothetical protein